MNGQEIESFPPEVVGRLKTYVYRLIDPRNGETFYVGKGKGNRVFSHIPVEQNLDGDEIDNKLRRIREIRIAGFDVAHVVGWRQPQRISRGERMYPDVSVLLGTRPATRSRTGMWGNAFPMSTASLALRIRSNTLGKVSVSRFLYMTY